MVMKARVVDPRLSNAENTAWHVFTKRGSPLEIETPPMGRLLSGQRIAFIRGRKSSICRWAAPAGRGRIPTTGVMVIGYDAALWPLGG
jgi:hypothetical protein